MRHAHVRNAPYRSALKFSACPFLTLNDRLCLFRGTISICIKLILEFALSSSRRSCFFVCGFISFGFRWMLGFVLSCYCDLGYLKGWISLFCSVIEVMILHEASLLHGPQQNHVLCLVGVYCQGDLSTNVCLNLISNMCFYLCRPQRRSCLGITRRVLLLWSF